MPLAIPQHGAATYAGEAAHPAVVLGGEGVQVHGERGHLARDELVEELLVHGADQKVRDAQVTQVACPVQHEVQIGVVRPRHDDQVVPRVSPHELAGQLVRVVAIRSSRGTRALLASKQGVHARDAWSGLSERTRKEAALLRARTLSSKGPELDAAVAAAGEGGDASAEDRPGPAGLAAAGPGLVRCWGEGVAVAIAAVVAGVALASERAPPCCPGPRRRASSGPRAVLVRGPRAPPGLARVRTPRLAAAAAAAAPAAAAAAAAADVGAALAKRWAGARQQARTSRAGLHRARGTGRSAARAGAGQGAAAPSAPRPPSPLGSRAGGPSRSSSCAGAQS
eukprot:scaffold5297_cov374-Prasinococcus_capsulatus_cf.AAC.14